MSDPLSTAASVIAVLQLSASVVGYINAAAGASRERKRLRDEIRACEYILRQLRDEADNCEEGQAWLETIEALEAPDAPLGRLQSTLQIIKSRLLPKDKGRFQKTLTSLKWPFSEKDVDKMFMALEREKALLGLALQNNSQKLIREIRKAAIENRSIVENLTEAVHFHSDQMKSGFIGIKDNIEGLRMDQNSDKTARRREEILKWLTRVDYMAQHHDYVARHEPETGRWLLTSTEFTAWAETPKKTLFCPGIPGAGKTILTSIVIDTLEKQFQDNEDTGVAYLYCDFKRHSVQTVECLLTDLLKQLLHRLPMLPSYLESLYDQCKKYGERLPYFNEIFTTLQSVCGQYARAFIVVDAIDEMSETHRSTFFDKIFALQAQHKVNLFATSRPLPRIVEMFANCPSLMIRAQPEDVRKYVDSHLHNLPSFVRKNGNLQTEIKERIMQVVDGMFLLAQMHLDSLIGKRSTKALRSALENLPSGSNLYLKTYEEVVKRIEAQFVDQVELAKQALSWIVCAQRPVTAVELQHALAVEMDEPEIDDDNLPGIDDIVSVCSGIVTIDSESDVIRLIHYTAQEFFAKKQKEWLPFAQTEIACTCVRYLSFEAFEFGPTNSGDAFEERLQSNPLYDYSAHNWGHHARMATIEGCSPEAEEPQESKNPGILHQIIREFLSNDKKLAASNEALFTTWEWTFIRTIRRKVPFFKAVPTNFAPTHLAAYFGLKDALVSLLQQGFGLNEPDSFGRTPLWLAVQNGHLVVVETLLLETDIDLESKDWNEDAPLSIAAGGGHYEIAKLLLDKGINPAPRGRTGWTPLTFASVKGHRAVAELLLDQGHADLMSRDEEGMTPISHAASHGREEVVQFLLSRGADPNDRDFFGLTPLMLAAYSGHENILTVLLGCHGVNPDPKDDKDRTPFWWAVENQHLAAVKLLLKQKVDINCQDASGNAPIFEAAMLGYQAICEILLEQNTIEPELKNYDGQTPLSAACQYGFYSIVELLLTKAKLHEPNSPDNSGKTPLHYAAKHGHLAIVELLVRSTAIDINAKDKEGYTPLWLAAKEKNVVVMEALLQATEIDVNCKSKNGLSILAWLGYFPSEQTTRPEAQAAILLLGDERVDVNSTDSGGRSPLHHAAGRGNLLGVELLLNKEVDVDARDEAGRTPLVHAALKGYADIVRTLIATVKVDVNWRDANGQTLLDLAVKARDQAKSGWRKSRLEEVIDELSD
ncbi:Ankyrin repeat domain-containing protein 50 [Fusarium austroafricanum]|uniref:protein S-acyltransferase n=1 Tax=Fusarium austroafricanum TaxID=2364996 RepID=A0A8H4NYL4_9HYPO|nr:Ankyrin repeat domain-containing protein 50 [Fusarium austroafricanum]